MLLALIPVPASATVPPANDDFDTATVISSLPATLQADTREATTATDDPACAGFYHTLWFRFTPDEDMPVFVRVEGGTQYENLSIYTGSRGNLTQLACDYTYPDGRAFHNLAATHDTTYYFMVGATEPGRGADLSLLLERIVPPPNDDFDQATPILGLPFSNTVGSRGATSAEDDPSCVGDGRTMWYSFTPTDDMTVRPSARIGNEGGAFVSAYTGSRGSLSQIACISGAGPSNVELVSGVTYYFMLTDRLDVCCFSELEFRLERVQLPSSLTLAISRRQVTYDKTVRITVHLDVFAEAPDGVVNIYRTSWGGPKTLVKSGEVDDAGNLAVTIRMKKYATFVAEWDGDEGFLPAVSNDEWVQVLAIIKGKLSGHYGTAGNYKLYHRGDDPKQTGTVIPNHAGKKMGFIAQVRLNGSWITVATATIRIRPNGSASLRLLNPSPGYAFRVRNKFRGDADHLGGYSPWQYFRVT